jgi:predicted O-methyltransferase YrrM
MTSNFNLSSQLFSEAFWRGVFAESDFFKPIQKQFENDSLGLESLRGQADYNTGSISAFSAWGLFLVCHYFKVRRAFEVGTFIGRSTMSIAKAMNLYGGGEIHTCDLSNDINIFQYPPTKIVQYKKQTSDQMLSALTGQFDFAFIDGRLSDVDISKMAQLLTNDAIIVLDDFEGMEKGVANLFNLRSHPQFQHFFLIPPPNNEMAEKLGFSSRSLTAVLIPTSLISLTNQA